MPDHLTCLLRNLYAGQEATVRIQDMEQWTDSKLGKEHFLSCILSLCLFKVYTEYIMQNAGLDETQAGIKMLGEISTTSDIDYTALMAEK